MKKLNIEINCGEKTCAKEPGKFCPFVVARRFGTVSFCRIWYDEDSLGRPLPLEVKEGWLQRRPECLDAEKE